jgi:uncharacterized DUF497 family protein
MWTWSADKDRANRRKHRISFDKAQRVFDDPLVVSSLDTDSVEERWRSIGLIGGVATVVVHTWDQQEGREPSGRIISARRATRHEKKAYQEGAF